MKAVVQSCCAANASSRQAGARFHISLNTADLNRAIAFFTTFLGFKPAKCNEDYAKFEMDDPPLVLSLEPGRTSSGGALNHLGFRMPDAAALVDVQRRLELAGISTVREDGVECCYARQTKFWVHDPDGNLWEVYTVDADIEHRGDGRLPVVTGSDTACDGEPAGSVWAHRLGEPFPQKLPILDATVDRVLLEGTFNERLAREEQLRRLAEVRRVLRPGGTVHLHMLTSDRPTSEQPLNLPGHAAAVEVVPETNAVIDVLRESGMANPEIIFHAPSACFVVDGCEFRETRLQAKAALHASVRQVDAG